MGLTSKRSLRFVIFPPRCLSPRKNQRFRRFYFPPPATENLQYCLRFSTLFSCLSSCISPCLGKLASSPIFTSQSCHLCPFEVRPRENIQSIINVSRPKHVVLSWASKVGPYSEYAVFNRGQTLLEGKSGWVKRQLHCWWD